ncbi:alpha-(1-_3)-arabinofuranosyltransferase domain-containing protein, partial [Nostocoides australiense]|uniref:alpha-(1->3)-arabinofuranosyltransferase domain-containing protein n=1 Tax=Nostocoides australiense TaxID=99480 RepID=UPI00066001E7
MAVHATTRASVRSVQWVALAVLVVSGARGGVGTTTWDTKLNLWVDPGRFLARSLHLWNPTISFGELQNQAYGYLFPQGPFALLGQSLGIPAWIVERGWTIVLLLTAYEGMRRVLVALAASGAEVSPFVPYAAVLAGLAYAGAPRLVGLSGLLTSEVQPVALLPWAVLPGLVHAAGRLSARAAGVLSGVAVLLMGGVNAVAVLATFPAIAVLIAANRRDRGRLALWTGLGVGAAIAWWLVPLVVLGRFSPRFLDVIETSGETTAPLGWFNVVRGADHWVAFTTSAGDAWWPGAYDLHSTPLGVLVTTAIVGLGLVGLAQRGLPYRGALLTLLVLGLVCLGIGHTGWAGSPLAPGVQFLLDRTLAMFRNVHKADGLARLPLAVGLGWLAVRIAERERVAAPRVPHRLAVVGAGGALLLLVPFVLAPQRMPGWTTPPAAWAEAGRWLNTHAAQGRSLVLPAAGFGDQRWGRTIDEPLQAWGDTAWVSRSQVPLTPPQTIRVLDALVSLSEDPGEAQGLVVALRRVGISNVVLRRDVLDHVVEPAVVARVAESLRRAPGIEESATFPAHATPEVEIYTVTSVERNVAQSVTATESSGVIRVEGGPEAVLAAIAGGVLPSDGVALVGRDADGVPGLASGVVVADGPARRERSFGRVRDAVGPVLTTRDAWTTNRPVHDFGGVPGSPETVAVFDGVAQVSASTSQATPAVLGPLRPGSGPQALVDGSMSTVWASDPLSTPTAQWVRVTLPTAVPLPSVSIAAGVNPSQGAPIRRLKVATDDGQTQLAAVDPVTGLARISLRGSAVRELTVEVTQVVGDLDRAAVTIREITLPGIEPARWLEVPPASSDGPQAFVLATPAGRRPCLIVAADRPECDPGISSAPVEAAGLSRRITVPRRTEYVATGVARAVAGPGTAELFLPLGGAAKVVASSVLGDDPAVSGAFAMDGRDDTLWATQTLTRSATLVVTYPGRRTLRGIAVLGAGGRVTTPARVGIATAQAEREVALGPGETTFAPLTATSFRIRVDLPATWQPGDPPLGLAELTLTGSQPEDPYAPRLDNPTGALCGLGPRLFIDGTAHDTEVTGTLGDVYKDRDLTVTVCGGPILLAAGRHDIRWEPSSRFVVHSARLVPHGWSTPSATTRDVTVQTWATTERTMDLGPGDTAVLSLPENRNAGWRATLAGAELPAVGIDGWRQGFVLPAGTGGRIVLEFTPDRPYRLGL